jgi:hypothetical protein
MVWEPSEIVATTGWYEGPSSWGLNVDSFNEKRSMKTRLLSYHDPLAWQVLRAGSLMIGGETLNGTYLVQDDMIWKTMWR